MGTPKLIKFGAGQASGYDELAGASPAFVNVIPEGNGFRARPGLRRLPTTFPEAGQVEAMAVFQHHLVYVTADRRILHIDTTGVVRDTSVDGPTSLLRGTRKPTLYAQGAYCLATGGSTPQRLTDTFASLRLASGTTSPPMAIDLAINTSRIVAIEEDKDEFFWSGPIQSASPDWDIDLEYASAEARPDYNVAIRDTAGEIWIFGQTSTQILVPDPIDTYAPAITNDVGCAARDSVIRVGNRMAWLDDLLRFQLSDGRSMGENSDISEPIKTTIDALSTVDDCWGFRARIRQHDLLVWVFPTAGKTLCYDLAQKAWCEWRGWRNGRWQSFVPTAYCWWPDMRMHIVGLSDGTLAELTFDAPDDLGDPIPWRARTGFNDYDTSARKDTRELLIRARPYPAQAASISTKWRDDLGSFCDPVTIQGESLAECDLSISPVGAPYLTRQHEFSGQADTTSYVASVTEDVDLPEDF